MKCYGADDVREGVAILHLEGVDVSITGNSTNPTRFQHPVAGTYKKECQLQGKKYFSVASGGGTGRTLHPDNMAAGPASYGMTDTLGRMHSDAQFAGSSSVPAHVEMMGLIGIIIAILVNMFIQSSAMSMIIGCIGVIVFVGLTAYDTQKIKNMALTQPADADGAVVRKGAILGALSLYLDFINLFLMLLRVLGNRD